MHIAHIFASGMGGIRTSGDLVAWMQLIKKMKIDATKQYVAQKLGVGIADLVNEEVMRQLLAAWLVVDEKDLPMNPRLIGKPGVGKTTMACAAARELGLGVFIMQATMDTRPEDLIVTPVLGPDGGLRYMASPLATAMISGGVPAGAAIPRQAPQVQSMPSSLRVGTSGNLGSFSAAMMASGLTLPASIKVAASGKEQVLISMPPAIRSCKAGAAPLLGIHLMASGDRPMAFIQPAMARCQMPPWPVPESFNLP